ncbi:MAG: hypothetical protein ABI683_15400 [Ginsengibacter sp.]
MKYLLALMLFTATSYVAFGQTTPTTRVITGLKVIEPKPSQTDATHSPNSVQDLPVTYTFTGNGNWNIPANWENNLVPPQPTNLGSEIIINNIPGGQCLLNIPYAVTPGTSLTILTSKTLVVPASFTVN